jgi:hypothetical protein
MQPINLWKHAEQQQQKQHHNKDNDNKGNKKKSNQFLIAFNFLKVCINHFAIVIAFKYPKATIPSADYNR